MENDLLEYCIASRKSGLDSDAIRSDLETKGLKESEIKKLIRESDRIFLENLASFKPNNKSPRAKNLVKMAALLGILLLLAFSFLGYIRIGLLLLFVMWSCIGMLRFIRKEGNYFSKSKYRN